MQNPQFNGALQQCQTKLKWNIHQQGQEGQSGIFWQVVDIDRSRSYSCGIVQGTHGFHLVLSSNNPLFKIWCRNLLSFASLVAVVNGMNVNAWIGLMIGIVCHLQQTHMQLVKQPTQRRVSKRIRQTTTISKILYNQNTSMHLFPRQTMNGPQIIGWHDAFEVSKS